MLDPYARLPIGTRLWHVHPGKYASTQFNANSRARFAVPGQRKMYYAGDSSDVALWESRLRNLVVNGNPVSIDPALLDGWSIAQVELLQELPIIDLRAPHFRRLSADEVEHTCWQRLCVTPEAEYPLTHACAKELLERFSGGAGMCWPSRQMSAGQAMVLYDPPAHDTLFKELFSHPLSARMDLVDSALAHIGIDRMDVAALSVGASPPV